jgi:hypothetical protein
MFLRRCRIVTHNVLIDYCCLGTARYLFAFFGILNDFWIFIVSSYNVDRRNPIFWVHLQFKIKLSYLMRWKALRSSMEQIPPVRLHRHLRNSSLLWYPKCFHNARRRTETSSWRRFVTIHVCITDVISQLSRPVPVSWRMFLRISRLS